MRVEASEVLNQEEKPEVEEEIVSQAAGKAGNIPLIRKRTDKMDEVLAQFKFYSYPSDMQEYLNQLALSVESLDVDSCMSILEFWEKEY